VISARTKAALAAAKAAGPSPAAIARTQPGFPITRPGASRRSRRWPTKLPRSDCRRSLGSRPRSYRWTRLQDGSIRRGSGRPAVRNGRRPLFAGFWCATVRGSDGGQA